MCKDISTRQDHNCILMKEEVEQSPWTVMKSEEKEDVLSKIMLTKYNYVVVRGAFLWILYAAYSSCY